MVVNYNPKIVTDNLLLCLDPSNKKSFSPNVFPNSLDIYEWYVPKRGAEIGSSCTVSRDTNTSASPAGGIPFKMAVTGNDPHINSWNSSTWNLAQVENGQTWVVSVYAKADVITTGEIYIFGANSSGTSSLGGGSYVGITAKTINITTEWQRFDHFITFNNVDVEYIHFRLDGPPSGGSGINVWWDGVQVERADAVTDFNPTYNANNPDYTDIISGLRFEPSNTDYIEYSNANRGIIKFTRTMPATTEAGGGIQTVGTGNLTAKNFLHNNHTIDVWFKPNDRDPTAYDATEVQSAVVIYRGFHSGIYYNTNTIYYSSWGNNGTTNASDSITFSNSTEGEWMNVVATSNFDTVILYLNGVQQATKNLSIGKVSIPTSSDLRIGKASDSGASFSWHADMDFGSLKMYNKALTAAEVLQNFNAFRGRFGI